MENLFEYTEITDMEGKKKYITKRFKINVGAKIYQSGIAKFQKENQVVVCMTETEVPKNTALPPKFLFSIKKDQQQNGKNF